MSFVHLFILVCVLLPSHSEPLLCLEIFFFSVLKLFLSSLSSRKPQAHEKVKNNLWKKGCRNKMHFLKKKKSLVQTSCSTSYSLFFYLPSRLSIIKFQLITFSVQVLLTDLQVILWYSYELPFHVQLLYSMDFSSQLLYFNVYWSLISIIQLIYFGWNGLDGTHGHFSI